MKQSFAWQIAAYTYFQGTLPLPSEDDAQEDFPVSYNEAFHRLLIEQEIKALSATARDLVTSILGDDEKLFVLCEEKISRKKVLCFIKKKYNLNRRSFNALVNEMKNFTREVLCA